MFVSVKKDTKEDEKEERKERKEPSSSASEKKERIAQCRELASIRLCGRMRIELAPIYA